MVKRTREDEDSAHLPFFGWASRRGCRFEQKGDPCKYRYDLAENVRKEKGIGEGASGAAHKKRKAGVRTVSIPPTSGDGDGSGTRLKLCSIVLG